MCLSILFIYHLREHLLHLQRVIQLCLKLGWRCMNPGIEAIVSTCEYSQYVYPPLSPRHHILQCIIAKMFPRNVWDYEQCYLLTLGRLLTAYIGNITVILLCSLCLKQNTLLYYPCPIFGDSLKNRETASFCRTFTQAFSAGVCLGRGVSGFYYFYIRLLFYRLYLELEFYFLLR